MTYGANKYSINITLSLFESNLKILTFSDWSFIDTLCLFLLDDLDKNLKKCCIYNWFFVFELFLKKLEKMQPPITERICNQLQLKLPKIHKMSIKLQDTLGKYYYLDYSRETVNHACNDLKQAENLKGPFKKGELMERFFSMHGLETLKYTYRDDFVEK